MSFSFRAKVKRAFTRQGERNSDASHEKSGRKGKKQKSEWPDNVYKPGEPMPKPKYGAPVNRAHQAKLSAFSFDDAWKRRASEQSEYSPRGSRLPSAVGSLRRKSFRPALRSRQASGNEPRLEENPDRDDDVANVGLSSAPPPAAQTGSSSTIIQRLPRTADSTTALRGHDNTHDSVASIEARPYNDSNTNKTMGMPFTEAELTLALTRTSLRS